MEHVRDLNEVPAAEPGTIRKAKLFASERFFADVHVLPPGRSQRVHAHAGEDKCSYVLSGTGLFTVGEEEIAVRAGHLVHCPAGVPHGVRNDTHEDLRLLVFMAPHPEAR